MTSFRSKDSNFMKKLKYLIEKILPFWLLCKFQMNSMKKNDCYNDIRKFAVLKFMLFSFQVSGSFRTTSSKKIKVSKPEKVKTLKISKVFQKEWLLPRKKQSTILPWTMSFQLSEDLISGNQWMTNFSLISNT